MDPASLSPMGAYGHSNVKPTPLFGTVHTPKIIRHTQMQHGLFTSFCFLSSWMVNLVKSMSEKDKRRIKKAAKETKKAMVIKSVNKKGKRSV